ncbi:MAG: 23S rRNA (adenine(2503)-C(2))-methyltransferase RlmN [Geminicoccaceae bacterium]
MPADTALPTAAGAGADKRALIFDLDRGELAAALHALGVAETKVAMRLRQLWHWLYHRGAVDFDVMHTLPGELRQFLADRFRIERPAIVSEQRSKDGTVKWLLALADGRQVETVFIPETDRGALCVSSQVGCTLSCSFCHTGTMALVRNLSAGEIIGQLLVARDRLGEWPSGKLNRMLTNIVLMGMGEPLFNYAAVAKALQVANDGEGIGISKRKVTLSTSGVVPKIKQCGEELGVGLAISLHAVRDELRDELVPINRKWNIETLIQACRTYPHRGKPITFEYVMLDGVNDTDQDARALVKLLEPVCAKVNLIPFNPWPGSRYACSPWSRIEAFAGILEAAGYASPVRTPRGRDILAACGQLKTASERAARRRVPAQPEMAV